MNKKIVVLAVVAAFGIPTAASAQTTLFGQFKYEVGYIDGGAVQSDGTVDGDNNLVHGTFGTRLGVRGAEDLGGGLQGIYRFQGNFSGANRSLATQNFRLNEEAWVGLQGGFGRLLVGRSDTAVKLAAMPFRNFTDTLADFNNIPGGWQRAEGLHYTSPNFAGATIGITIEPTGDTEDVYAAANVIYRQGSLFVSAAIEDSPGSATFAVGDIGVDETNWQVGVSWDFGQGDIGIQYQARNDGDDDVVIIPVNYKVLPNLNLRGAVKYVDPDVGSDFTNFAIGAQYMFSGRTELYANLWGDDEIGQTPAGANVSDASTHFGIGLRHSF